MCFTLLFSVAFSILALNSSWIAFLHSALNFAGFFSIVSAGIPSFCRYSLFSMAQLSFSFLLRMVLRVLFCPWLIRLCMFSLFLFIIAIGSRNPVSMYVLVLSGSCIEKEVSAVCVWSQGSPTASPSGAWRHRPVSHTWMWPTWRPCIGQAPKLQRLSEWLGPRWCWHKTVQTTLMQCRQGACNPGDYLWGSYVWTQASDGPWQLCCQCEGTKTFLGRVVLLDISPGRLRCAINYCQMSLRFNPSKCNIMRLFHIQKPTTHRIAPCQFACTRPDFNWENSRDIHQTMELENRRGRAMF